ncbi:uncharacterized protein V1516DRAFT_662228 [Lipomyces oligophaga]|uniref:uncharacterized protein n=1 Tax=Lipomyces oligophaga TaxID=45792 RepID=UPI0034CE8C16
MSNLETAIYSWIRIISSRAGLSAPDSLAELSNGHLISQILIFLDAARFQDCEIADDGISQSTSFMATVRNLKKLYKTIQQSSPKLSALDEGIVPNISLIAKDGDVEEIVKLLSLVMMVESEITHDDALDDISQLPEEERPILLKIIGQPDDEKPDFVAPSPVSSDSLDYRALESLYAQLQSQFNRVQEKLDQTKIENSDLKEQLSKSDSKLQLQLEIQQSKSKGQIEYFQKDIQHLEEQLVERDKKVTEFDSKLLELTNEIEGLHGQVDSITDYKDRIDELSHDNERLRKVASQIEKYKKQAQECTELSQQLVKLKNDNAYLQEKSRLLDQDTQQVFGLRKQVEILQTEQEFYRRKAKEAEKAAESMTEELEFMREKVQKLELKLELDRQQANQITAAMDNGPSVLERSDFDNGENVADSLRLDQEKDYIRTINELRVRLSQLESNSATVMSDHQSSLKHQDTGNIDELKKTLQDTIEHKEKLQEDFLTVYHEKLELQAQIQALEDGSGRGFEMYAELRHEFDKTEIDLKASTTQIKELEAQIAKQDILIEELRTDLALVDKDKSDMLSGLRQSVSKRLVVVETEIKGLQQEKRSVETDKSQTLQLLDKALLEKESLYQKLTANNEELLEVSRANTALRMSLASLDPAAAGGAGHDSELRGWLVDLQRKSETQREKLRKAQDYIRKLKSENDMLRKPVDALRKKQVTITAEQAAILKNEQRMMTSAWYSLASRIQHNRIMVAKKGQENPASWLSRQRKILEESK